jgi:hypothetical protein
VQPHCHTCARPEHPLALHLNLRRCLSLSLSLSLSPTHTHTGDRKLSVLGEQLCDGMESFFEDVAGQIKPSVLHGDLWSGNIAGVDGQPAVFDPATYYGHHEAEWGMSWCAGACGRRLEACMRARTAVQALAGGLLPCPASHHGACMPLTPAHRLHRRVLAGIPRSHSAGEFACGWWLRVRLAHAHTHTHTHTHTRMRACVRAPHAQARTNTHAPNA